MTKKGVLERITTTPTPFLLFFVIVFLLYSKSLFAGFSYLDDNALILDNMYFLKNPGNLVEVFKTDVFHTIHSSPAYYRPTLLISFMLDSWIGGNNPFIYHFTNIVIHFVNVCLLFILLKKLDYEKTKSFVFSLLFAVHPALVQAVSWIPGRNDTLLFLFGILSFLFFIRYLDRKSFKNLFFHIVFFLIALFTKETAIVLPLFFLFYTLIANKKNLRTLPFVQWFIAFVIWFFMRSIALSSGVKYEVYSMLVSFVKNMPAMLLYLGKVFIPVNLSVFPILVDSDLIYGIVSFSCLVLIFLVKEKKKFLKITFGAMWFFTFLSISLVKLNTEYTPDFIEHRMYFAMIGLIIFLLETIPFKKINKNILTGVTPVMLVCLFILNFVYQGNFMNRLSFWENAVKNSPSHPLSHKNLGAMYFLDGDNGKAEKEFLKAVEINANEKMIYNNLGLVYFNKKDFDRAEEMYKKETEINPYYDDVYFNWGLLYSKKNDSENAEKMWLKTLKINSDHLGALKNLSLLYQEEGNSKLSEYYYGEAVKRGR